MQNITISSYNHETYTAISNLFIDHYMTNANGEYVKVYLYLVRIMNSASSLSIAAIADHFDMTENDICRAIRYWVRQKLIQLNYDENKTLIGITLLPLQAIPEAENEKSDSIHKLISEPSVSTKPADKPSIKAETKQETKESVSINQPPQKESYSSVTMNLRKKEDHVFADLVYELETIYNKQLTVTDLQTLLYIYDSLHFSQELIEYLLDYCAKQKKTDLRYMEKVAMAWYEKGIRDIDSAKQENNQYNTVYMAVLRALGISGMITDGQKQYIDGWHIKYGYSQEIILEACRRASVNNPKNVNFAYVDGIIKNWHEAGVRTLSDINKKDASHARNKSAVVKSFESHANQFNQYTHEDNSEQIDALSQFFAQEVNGTSK